MHLLTWKRSRSNTPFQIPKNMLPKEKLKRSERGWTPPLDASSLEHKFTREFVSRAAKANKGLSWRPRAVWMSTFSTWTKLLSSYLSIKLRSIEGTHLAKQLRWSILVKLDSFPHQFGAGVLNKIHLLQCPLATQLWLLCVQCFNG